MELKNGEVICPYCKGSCNQALWDIMPDYRVYLECQHCNGDGKMDWIEAVVGKKPEIKFGHSMLTQYSLVGIKNPSSLIISGNIA